MLKLHVNCMLILQIVCYAMWHVHVKSRECSQEVCCTFIWDCKSNARLARALL